MKKFLPLPWAPCPSLPPPQFSVLWHHSANFSLSFSTPPAPDFLYSAVLWFLKPLTLLCSLSCWLHCLSSLGLEGIFFLVLVSCVHSFLCILSRKTVLYPVCSNSRRLAVLVVIQKPPDSHVVLFKGMHLLQRRVHLIQCMMCALHASNAVGSRWSTANESLGLFIVCAFHEIYICGPEIHLLSALTICELPCGSAAKLRGWKQALSRPKLYFIEHHEAVVVHSSLWHICSDCSYVHHLIIQ